LKTEEGNFIGLKKKKLSAENIAPQPVIRHGKAPPEDPSKPIELVETAHWPVFRGETVDNLVNLFAENGLKPEAIYKDADAETAKSKFTTLMNATLQLLTTQPLDTYKRGYVDRQGRKVESADVYTYKVASVNEATGREVLEEFPYLELTHIIEEKDEQGLTVWPRMYYDMWLPDSIYQLTGKTDADRFELWKLAQKLNEYPFPVKNKDGSIKLDDNGDPVINYDEAMIVKQGYIASTGSTKAYHALIVPERIQTQGEDKFVFLMKLTRTVRKFAEAMEVPKPGEVPVSTTREQKPLVMESFAEMLSQVAA